MMKRILIPTDFSEASLAALRYGLDLAETVGGEIILLHVVEETPVFLYAVGERPVFLMDAHVGDLDLSRYRLPQHTMRHDLCEEAYWKLASLVSPGEQKRVHTVVTVGKPAKEIVRVAREQEADLIMLGSRGRRGLRRLLRRTVADKVMRKASIPVIVVDADRPRFGSAFGHQSAPDQHIQGGHAKVQGVEPMVPRPMSNKTRVRPHAPKRARALNSPARR